MDWNNFYGGQRLKSLGARPLAEVNKELGDNLWRKIHIDKIDFKIEEFDEDILIAVVCPNNMSRMTAEFTKVVITSNNWNAFHITWIASETWYRIVNKLDREYNPWNSFEFHWRKAKA